VSVGVIFVDVSIASATVIGFAKCVCRKRTVNSFNRPVRNKN